jgi:hypothetical protein
MPKSKRDLRKCLLSKFQFSEEKKRPHEAVALFVDGKQVATVYFSRSWDDIDDEMLGYIARKQLWVTSKYLRGMYDCTINRDDYLQHLRDSGHLA